MKNTIGPIDQASRDQASRTYTIPILVVSKQRTAVNLELYKILDLIPTN